MTTERKRKAVCSAIIAAALLSVVAFVLAFTSGGRVMGKSSAKIMLYDGEEKRLIGEVSASDLKSYSEAFNVGEIIYHIDSKSNGGNFVSEISGPVKTMKADEGGAVYTRVFGGWYIESPTKLYVSKWNWDESNSIAGISLFDEDGTPDRRLWNDSKKEYRLYAYWIPDGYFRPVISYKDDTAGDGFIDELYINATVPRGDIFEEAGFLIDERPDVTDEQLRLEGSPLYVERCAEMFTSVKQSGCYGNLTITSQTVTGFDSNGYADDGRVLSFHWNGINAFDTFSARVYLVTREGSVVYGPITTVKLTDGGQLLPMA